MINEKSNRKDGSRQYLFGLITLILSLCVILLIAELTIRFVYFGWNSFSIEKMNSMNSIGTSGLIQEAKYQDVLYELKPNLNTTFRLHEFRTNSHGLRDDEYSFSKPANTYRVAVVGDSWTMGEGVDQKEIYSSILETKLKKSLKTKKVEVINFGVGGYGLSNYKGVIVQKALKYEPDLIIIGFCWINDFDIIGDKQSKKPFKIKKMESPFYTKSFFLGALKNTLIFSLNKKAAHNEGLESGSKSENSNESSKAKLVNLNDNLEIIKNETKKHDVPVIVVYLTITPDTNLNDIVRDASEKNELLFLDTSPKFIGQNVDSMAVIPKYDYHPNSKANKLFADQIYGYMQKNDLIN